MSAKGKVADIKIITYPDWVTIEVDGEKIIDGHSVDHGDVQELLEHLGYSVTHEEREEEDDFSFDEEEE